MPHPMRWTMPESMPTVAITSPRQHGARGTGPGKTVGRRSLGQEDQEGLGDFPGVGPQKPPVSHGRYRPDLRASSPARRWRELTASTPSPSSSRRISTGHWPSTAASCWANCWSTTPRAPRPADGASPRPVPWWTDTRLHMSSRSIKVMPSGGRAFTGPSAKKLGGGACSRHHSTHRGRQLARRVNAGRNGMANRSTRTGGCHETPASTTARTGVTAPIPAAVTTVLAASLIGLAPAHAVPPAGAPAAVRDPIACPRGFVCVKGY